MTSSKIRRCRYLTLFLYYHRAKRAGDIHDVDLHGNFDDVLVETTIALTTNETEDLSQGRLGLDFVVVLVTVKDVFDHYYSERQRHHHHQQ